MSEAAITHVIDCQQALIIALDARDADAINAASAALANAVVALKARGAWVVDDVSHVHVDRALKQADAARARVNYLSQWTRQKLDAMTALRSGARQHTYARPRKAGL